MSRLVKSGVCMALIFLGLPGAVSANAATTVASTITVARIVDGDTADFDVDGSTVRVRFLNINTPEVGTCLAAKATRATRRALPSQSRAVLAYDLERHDGYGRTLAFVTNAHGMKVSVELARRGLGEPIKIEPNHHFYGQVRRAAWIARDRHLGFFDPSRHCTPAHHLRQAKKQARAVRRMPVRTRAQYRHARAQLNRAARANRAVTLVRYALAGAWMNRYLKNRRAAVAKTIDHVRAVKRAQRRHWVNSHHHSHSGGSTGGSTGGSGGSGSGYNGPRCYEPGGLVWHPCRVVL